VTAGRVWQAAPAEPRLGADRVDVWRIGLDRPAACRDRLAATLSADELERAERFAFPELRRRYLVARGALRQILGHYAGAAPGRLRFGYGRRGKPFLREPATGGLAFNLAHSDDTALCAVTRAGDVGVDLERRRPLDDLPGLAGRCFSQREQADLALVPPGDRVAAFFACWTRKEAYVKALGDGLAAPLHGFDVTLAPGEPAALLAIGGDRGPAGRWTLLDLPVGGEFTGAVAVAAPSVEPRLLRWEG
jgi:4'-phosphopantetheinyl transferase